MKNREQVHNAAKKFNAFSKRQQQAFVLGANYITKTWYDAVENPPTDEYQQIVVIDVEGNCKVANFNKNGIDCDWFIKWMPLPI